MQGPRQDGGSLFDNDNPGVQLAERIYNYCGKYHSKTKVMVAGFRNKAGEPKHAAIPYLHTFLRTCRINLAWFQVNFSMVVFEYNFMACRCTCISWS